MHTGKQESQSRLYWIKLSRPPFPLLVWLHTHSRPLCCSWELTDRLNRLNLNRFKTHVIYLVAWIGYSNPFCKRLTTQEICWDVLWSWNVLKSLVIMYVNGSVSTVKRTPFNQWANISQTTHLSAKNSNWCARHLAWEQDKDLLANAIGLGLSSPSSDWELHPSRPLTHQWIKEMACWKGQN